MSRRGAFTQTTRRLILDRDEGACFACGAWVYDVWLDVPRLEYSIQHRRARGMGGSADPATSSAANGVVLCGSATTGCHGRVEGNPMWAGELGYRIPQHADPAAVPAHHVNRGPVYLTPEGNFSTTPPTRQETA